MPDTEVDLTKEAILIDINIAQKNRTARSNKLRQEVADAHGAEVDSLTVSVRKLEGESITKLAGIAVAARKVVKENTLAWDERFRLLPTTRLLAVQTEIDKLKNQWDDELSELAKSYDVYRVDYERRVGADIATEIPFPTREEILSGYSWEFEQAVIANPADIRLRHVSPQLREQIREQAELALSQKLTGAHTDLVNRLRELVERVKDQTSSEDKRIFDTLLGSVQEAVEIMPALNVKRDPELARLIAKLKDEIAASATTEELRAQPEKRQKVNKAAGDLSEALANYK